MRLQKFIIIIFLSVLTDKAVAQTQSTSNIVNATGVTAIQSTKNTSYQLSVGGAVKQFGTGLNGVRSPTLFLHNTSTPGGHFGLNSGDDGSFRLFDVSAANAIRFMINNAGNIGIGTNIPSSQLHTTGSVRFQGLTTNNTLTNILAADASGNLSWRDAATLGGNSGGWNLNGNTGTTPGVDFIGTTDNKAFVIKSNGRQVAWFGGNSIDLGSNNYNGGMGSINIGTYTEAMEPYSIAMGYGTYAWGESSTAMGNGSTASGSFSTAMGYGTLANGEYATAMGYNTNASNIYSTAIGNTIQAQYPSQLAIGMFNGGPNGSMPNQLFTIGNGTSTNSRKNAFVVYQSGINQMPLYKNNGAEDSVLTTDINGNLKLKSFSAGSNSNLWTDAGNGNIFNTGFTGNVGIGTNAPAYKLDVRGTTRILAGHVPDAFRIEHSDGFAHFNYDGTTGVTSIYKLASGALVTDANGDVTINGNNRFLSIQNGSYIRGYQQSVKVVMWYPNITNAIAFEIDDDGQIPHSNYKPLSIKVNSVEKAFVNKDGGAFFNSNVGIGTTNPGTYKLAVAGNIHAQKVRVDIEGWSDYVFDKDYRLRTLTELQEYINQHKHLPDVPSAKEVENNGIDLGENQSILLKKIEELTLYTLEQNKQLENQAKKLEQQQQQIDELKKLIIKK